jgi:hypothetical protein
MLSGDMVREVEYAQTSSDVSPHNAITVNGASTGAAKGSAVGYHLGGDFTYFVHRAVGIAGGIRYGRATVAVEQRAALQSETGVSRGRHDGVSWTALPVWSESRVRAEGIMRTRTFLYASLTAAGIGLFVACWERSTAHQPDQARGRRSPASGDRP